MQVKDRIAIIGAGNMARTLVSGWVRSGWPPEGILLCSPGELNRNYLVDQYAVKASSENAQSVLFSDIIILAVKPPMVSSVLEELKGGLTPRHVIVSLAAGVTIKTIKCIVGDSITVLRAMPNTPCALNKGIIGLYSPRVQEKIIKRLEFIFALLGLVFWLTNEAEFDAVTVLFGSGPAYIFLLMERLQSISVELGVSRGCAKKMVEQLIEGAVLLAQNTDQDYALMRAAVTSAGGTTEAAITQMELSGFSGALRDGIIKGMSRAQEIQQSTEREGPC